MIFSKIKNSKTGGTMLLLTLIILSSILLVSLTMGDIVVSGLRVARVQVNSTNAYFAAEAGAESFLYEIRENSLDLANCDLTTNKYIDLTLDEDSCQNTKVVASFSNGAQNYIEFITDTPLTIISFGEYKDTFRAVKISF